MERKFSLDLDKVQNQSFLSSTRFYVVIFVKNFCFSSLFSSSFFFFFWLFRRDANHLSKYESTQQSCCLFAVDKPKVVPICIRNFQTLRLRHVRLWTLSAAIYSSMIYILYVHRSWTWSSFVWQALCCKFKLRVEYLSSNCWRCGFSHTLIHIIKDQKLTFNILYSSIPLIASVSRHFATIKNGSLAAFSERTASIWQILFAHSLEDGLGHLRAPCLRKFQFQFRASQALGTWPVFPGKCEPWVGGSLDELHFSSGPRDRKCYSKLWQLSAAPRKWKWIYGKLTLDSRRNIWYGIWWSSRSLPLALGCTKVGANN